VRFVECLRGITSIDSVGAYRYYTWTSACFSVWSKFLRISKFSPTSSWLPRGYTRQLLLDERPTYNTPTNSSCSTHPGPHSAAPEQLRALYASPTTRTANTADAHPISVHTMIENHTTLGTVHTLQCRQSPARKPVLTEGAWQVCSTCPLC
jgi:hypothetical protein